MSADLSVVETVAPMETAAPVVTVPTETVPTETAPMETAPTETTAPETAPTETTETTETIVIEHEFTSTSHAPVSPGTFEISLEDLGYCRDILKKALKGQYIGNVHLDVIHDYTLDEFFAIMNFLLRQNGIDGVWTHDMTTELVQTTEAHMEYMSAKKAFDKKNKKNFRKNSKAFMNFVDRLTWRQTVLVKIIVITDGGEGFDLLEVPKFLADVATDTGNKYHRIVMDYLGFVCGGEDGQNTVRAIKYGANTTVFDDDLTFDDVLSVLMGIFPPGPAGNELVVAAGRVTMNMIVDHFKTPVRENGKFNMDSVKPFKAIFD